MRKLLLHIGHGKTGSSMLQSSFRLSRGRLAGTGITYGAGADENVIDELQITSGNGTGLVSQPGALAATLAPHAGGSDHLLYSSEMLFGEFLKLKDPERLIADARKAGFDGIDILLFVRDPMGHASSLWQQGVKRGGKTEPIEAAFRAYKFPALVAKFLKTVQPVDGYAVTLRNYSACRKSLLAETERWLGVPEGTLVAPKAARVNRSMTRAELELQMAFNAHLGKCGDLISDPLCEKLHDVRPDDIRPPVEVQQETWDRLQPPIRTVNAVLPKEHRYRFDVKEPPADDGVLEFTPEQVRVFVESICDRMKRMREMNQKLSRRRCPSATRRESEPRPVMRAGGSQTRFQAGTGSKRIEWQ